MSNKTMTRQTEAAPPAGRAGDVPWLRIVAAVVGGVLLYLSFEPIALWPLAPVGIASITLAVKGCRARRGAWLGLVAGAAFFFPALRWVTVIGWDTWFMLAPAESLFFALLGAAIAAVVRLPGWPVWAAALWVAQEQARGAFPFGGFPWARVAFSQGDTAYTAFAAVGGAALVTFLVALTGGLIALAVTLRGRALAFGVAAALALPALGAVLPRPTPTGPAVKVAVVQGNVPGRGMYFLGDEAGVVLANHANKTHELAKAVREGRMQRPDVVVWPENSTDIDPYRDPEAYKIINDAVRDIGVPVLVGAVVRADDGVHRQTRSIVWDPVTGPGASYNKQKPVPFGEFIPFRDLLMPYFDRLRLAGRDTLAGDTPGALRLGPVVVGAVNCYEIAFDGVVRGTAQESGGPLVVQTNNATWAFTGLPQQQLAMSQLRAVEHGRTVVTVATTGVSAVVEPDGRVRWQTEEFVPEVRVDTVHVGTRQTPATRFGGMQEWALTLLGLGAVAVAAVKSRRRRPAGGEAEA
ncbi:apolipoprotein N-acyltransferase [Rhizohabitans arisaemae]|uniref:apolipoprotein N-acyltransferase n=1 Tax=Rhizohabitans arisaemae TaxID=2720610 RepID=UPI0024B1EFA8|nr:apolipoprotein N-acyltransferase [Rhizohabitans arisaemae]